MRFCGARMRARCRRALAAPCEFVLVSANPLLRSCVSKRSLRRRAILLLAKWPLEVSRGLRACFRNRAVGFDSPLVRGSSGSSKEAVVCGVYSWWLRPENRNPEAQTYSARSTSTAQLRLSILRTDTSAERLAERNLHRATCAEQLEDRCRATCTQKLAESNLRAAACNNAACADTAMFPLVGRGDGALMRPYTLSIAACRHARRIDVKRCLRGWKSAWGKMLSGQSSSSFPPPEDLVFL